MAPQPLAQTVARWNKIYDVDMNELKDNFPDDYQYFRRICRDLDMYEGKDRFHMWSSNEKPFAYVIALFKREEHQPELQYPPLANGDGYQPIFGKLYVFQRNSPTPEVSVDVCLVDRWQIYTSSSCFLDVHSLEVNYLGESVDNWMDFAGIKENKQRWPNGTGV